MVIYYLHKTNLKNHLNTAHINPKTMNKQIILLPVLAAILFFSFGTASVSVYAQTDNNINNQTANLDQIASNLTQASEALSGGGNYTEVSPN